MKFVIRSLLFVNLLLLMTNSLRQCFNHDQNIMITIILLAFSVIALIGLVIGNRFILIIFSASMTLILIASITIYAIGKTGEDTLRPKVPYFTKKLMDHDPSDPTDKRKFDDDNAGKHKFKPLVDRWLPGAKNNKEDTPRVKNRARYNKTRANITKQKQQLARVKANAKTTKDDRQPGTLATALISPSLLNDLSDEPTSVIQLQDIIQEPTEDPNTRSQFAPALAGPKLVGQPKLLNQKISPLRADDRSQFAETKEDQEPENDPDGDEQVVSEQWVAYERYLYERYLNIVSQSIDLVLHTILAAWMALLLDEDSDHCFGTKTSVMKSLASVGQASKAPPVYNYNGVRYSIRPDVDDSMGRIVVN